MYWIYWLYVESRRKPNKIWVDKGTEYYNRSIKSWLEKNDVEMFSIHNEGKSAATERFIKTLLGQSLWVYDFNI